MYIHVLIMYPMRVFTTKSDTYASYTHRIHAGSRDNNFNKQFKTCFVFPYYYRHYVVMSYYLSNFRTLIDFQSTIFKRMSEKMLSPYYYNWNSRITIYSSWETSFLCIFIIAIFSLKSSKSAYKMQSDTIINIINFKMSYILFYLVDHILKKWLCNMKNKQYVHNEQ